MDEHSKGERQMAQVCFGVQSRKGGARSQIQYTFYTVEELSCESISVIWVCAGGIPDFHSPFENSLHIAVKLGK